MDLTNDRQAGTRAGYGTRVRPEDTELAVRARDLLAAGPADSATLIAHVCRMSGTPPVVADHLAFTLFAGRADFARDDEGMWRLVSGIGNRESRIDRTRTIPASRSPRPEPRAARVSERHPDLFGAHESPPVRASHARAQLSLDAIDYVVVDVETTGGSSWGRDRITEIAAVHVRNGRVVDQFESLVNPERSIPPMISALTNITWSMVEHAPRFGELCDRLVPMLEGKIFVAHNANFDWRFVTTEVARATGQRLEGERLCTVRLARALLPELHSRRLDALAHYYGITIAQRHRAGGDARATAEVLIRLLREAADRDCLTFEAVRELIRRRPRRRGRKRRGAMPRGMNRDTSA